MKDKESESLSYFDPNKIGSSLDEVSIELIKTESQNITSRWFHSALDADFFIWQDEKKVIVKQQLTFLGQVVEWNILEGVRTGIVMDEDENDKMMGSEIIHFDSNPVRQTVQQGLKIVSYIDGLNDIERQQIIQNFSSQVVGLNISPKEFIERFGEREKSEHTTFLSKIFKFLKAQIFRF